MPATLSPRLLKAARALAGWEVEELARQAGVERAGVAAFETGPQDGSASDAAALVTALARAGVTFIEERGEAVGVRFAVDGESHVDAAPTVPVEQLNAANDE